MGTAEPMPSLASINGSVHAGDQMNDGGKIWNGFGSDFVRKYVCMKVNDHGVSS